MSRLIRSCKEHGRSVIVLWQYGYSRRGGNCRPPTETGKGGVPSQKSTCGVFTVTGRRKKDCSRRRRRSRIYRWPSRRWVQTKKKWNPLSLRYPRRSISSMTTRAKTPRTQLIKKWYSFISFPASIVGVLPF